MTKITTTVMSGTQVSTTIADVFEYDADRRLTKITETSVSSGTSTNLIQTYTYASGMVASAKTEGTVAGTSVSVVTTWT
ncbi:MAG TPA: hypothetical protein VG737_01610, partial [Cyclobacteriaceae bacterium]|nr:hypothetical protein [Cyclobacteriaceae bacterium]